MAQYHAIFSGKKISLLQISDCLLWEYFETVALTQQGRGNKTIPRDSILVAFPSYGKRGRRPSYVRKDARWGKLEES